MASIDIPEEALLAFKHIMEMDEAVFSSLISALAASEPKLSRAQFGSQVTKRFTAIKESEVFPILETALTIHRLKETYRMESGEAAGMIARAAIESESTGTHFEEQEFEKLKNRLSRLLENSALETTSKALGVMRAHKNVFCKAKIYTDIRPIFKTKSDDVIAGMLIHNLKIGFHDQSEHKDFYVALDSDDLEKLKLAIAEAEKQSLALRSILKQSHVSYLEP